MAAVKKIQLVPEQVEKLSGIFDSQREFGVSIDGSAPGAGKTIMALALGENIEENYAKPANQQMVMLVIQPGTIQGSGNESSDVESISPWERESKLYGKLDLYHPVTYESLRPNEDARNRSDIYITLGGNNSPIVSIYDNVPETHFKWASEQERLMYDNPDPYGGNLTIDNKYSSWFAPGLIYGKYIKNQTGKGRSHVFSPTKKLMQLFLDFVVVVFVDEFHLTKNNTDNNGAVAAVMRAAMRAREIRADKAAFVHMMSGTPMQKKENAVNYMRLLGMHNPVANNVMFVTSHNPRPFDCFMEAFVYNPQMAVDIAIQGGVAQQTTAGFQALGMYDEAAKKATYRFFKECILPRINFFVPSPSFGQTFTAMFNIKRPQDLQLLNQADALLKQYSAEDPNAPRVGKESYFGLRSDARFLTEQAMLYPIGQDALQRLASDPMCKVIIALRRVENVDALMQMFSGYSPLRFVAGQITKSQKEQIRSTFQLNDHSRVLIGTLQALAVGMNFQDIKGGRQVVTYMIGDDDIVMMIQMEGRTDRRDTQSYPIILVAYPKQFGHTISIYKGNVSKTTEAGEILKSRKRSSKEETDPEFLRFMYNSVLPGDYNRAIQLDEIGWVYLLDRPRFVIDRDAQGIAIGYHFSPPEGTFGYIGNENTPENRAAYADTVTLIMYLDYIVNWGKEELQKPLSAPEFTEERLHYLLDNIPAMKVSEILSHTLAERSTTKLIDVLGPGGVRAFLLQIIQRLPGIRLDELVPSSENPAANLAGIHL